VKKEKISALKSRLLTVLPTRPHPGLDPFAIEREVHKDGKHFTENQWEEAIDQLLREGQLEENHGLFRRKTD
jgi:hypothetical protein